jgi:hypothetical protein
MRALSKVKVYMFRFFSGTPRDLGPYILYSLPDIVQGHCGVR